MMLSLFFCPVPDIPTVNDSGTMALEQVMKKCMDSYLVDQFVFKFLGRGEYIYGDPKVIDYDHVRYSLRHQVCGTWPIIPYLAMC